MGYFDTALLAMFENQKMSTKEPNSIIQMMIMTQISALRRCQWVY